MDNLSRLQQAETYLAESKRAGAILEIIDVCREQQRQIDQLRNEASPRIRNDLLLDSVLDDKSFGGTD